DRLALGDGLVIAAPARRAFGPGHGDLRKKAEIDVHRLEAAGAAIAFGFDVPAGDMGDQRAQRRGPGWRGHGLAARLGGGEPPGDEPHSGAFHIALDARHLTGEADTWII